MNPNELPTELTPGKELQNRYRIIQTLGKGGMGCVYEAERIHFGTTVALKQTFFDEQNKREWFKNEAKLLHRLDHRFLPKVHDYFCEDGGCYLVMDYIAGPSLDEMMEKDGPFSPPIIFKLGDMLLEALDYLHGQQSPIIHRDIKPQNIKVLGEDKVFLLDFGLAKDSLQTLVPGYTKHYSSLEQERGLPTDSRSDIYALGATLYHLLTGELPTDAYDRHKIINSGQPDPLLPAHKRNTQIPSALSAILHKAMALEPNKRFSSAKEMRIALRNLVYKQQHDKRFSRWLKQISARQMLWLSLAVVFIGTLLFMMRSGLFSQQNGIEKQIPVVETPTPEAPANTTPTPGNNASQNKLVPYTTVDTVSKIESLGMDELITISPASPSLSGEAKSEWCKDNFFHGIDFSPDGKTIAYGCSRGDVVLWNYMSGEQRKLEGCRLAPGRSTSGNVEELHFSADGQRLAAKCTNNPHWAIIWDIPTGKEIGLKFGNLGSVDRLAISPDSKSIATASRYKFLRFWNLETQQVLLLNAGCEGFAQSLNYSADGKLLVFGCGGYSTGGNSRVNDSKIHVWNLETGESKTIEVFNESEEYIIFTRFTPDNKQIVAASNKSVKVIDLENGAELTMEYKGDIQAVALSPDGKTVAYGGQRAGKSIILWDLSTRKLRTIEMGTWIKGLKYSPDGKNLAVGLTDNIIWVVNASGGNENKY